MDNRTKQELVQAVIAARLADSVNGIARCFSALLVVTKPETHEQTLRESFVLIEKLVREELKGMVPMLLAEMTIANAKAQSAQEDSRGHL